MILTSRGSHVKSSFSDERNILIEWRYISPVYQECSKITVLFFFLSWNISAYQKLGIHSRRVRSLFLPYLWSSLRHLPVHSVWETESWAQRIIDLTQHGNFPGLKVEMPCSFRMHFTENTLFAGKERFIPGKEVLSHPTFFSMTNKNVQWFLQ